MTRILTGLAAAAAVVMGTIAPVSAVPATAAPSGVTSHARAVETASSIVKTSLSGFNAGNIISDAVFTNKNTMTEAQIQSFFNSKVSRCQVGKDENGKPFVCLKDFHITSVTRPADAYCSGYKGQSNESAARIIYRVAQACNINPQVLIVMLQKEQGLVTHTWPSAWRYNIALGQGCPDTAPCDPGYIGFFHQIYGAARQMQMYMEGRYFTWYAPGKTWNILYHPNKGCGTSPVRVANKATSALYYYTPYQPNAAALRAGYGTGDGCSSYGNRNFYNYFTDWFGSTQNPTAKQGLVKVGTAVWLLAGKNRYHITAEAYPEYKPVFGAPAVVSAATLTPYKEGTRGSFYVKNASTGVVAMLQGKKTHRFPTCGMVEQWGGKCGAGLVVLTNAQFAKFGSSSEMTTFGRRAANGRIHQIAGSTLIPLYDAAVAKARNGGKTPYAAVFPAAVLSRSTVDKQVRFLPATFVKATTAPEVWLADESGQLRHLPSWQQAAELGLPSSVGARVASSDLAGYKKSGTLGSFVKCGSTNYVAASGKLSALKGPVPSGFTAVALDAATCAKLNLKGPALAGDQVFVKFSGTSTVYHLFSGQYRPVSAAAERAALNGGVAPTILVAGAAYRSVVDLGVAYPRSGSLVRVTGTPEVWLVDGSTLVHLPSWPMAAEYGLASKSELVSAAAVTGMQKRPSLTSFAVCADTTYVAAGGRLRAVAASRLDGNTTTALGAAVCGERTTGSPVDAPIFVGDDRRTAVAVNGGFLVLPDAASVKRAAAGAPVVVNQVASAYLDSLPVAVVPGEGALIRASNDSTVTLVNGDLRQRLPNWGVAADLGIQERYEIVSPAAAAARGIGGTELGIFVRCGSTTYVGSQGTLRPVAASALGGFAAISLSDATCRTLRLGTDKPLSAVRLVAPDGQSYVPVNGELVPVDADKSTTALPVDTRTVAGMPRA